MLGIMYFRGNGVETDYVRAREFFEQVPDDMFALNYLADIYYEGLGVEKDLEKSKYYRQKAEKIEKINCLENLLNKELQKRRIDLAPMLVKELIKEGKNQYEYYAKVFEKIGNKRIIKAPSIASFIGRSIEGDIGGIAIFPNENFYIYSHTVYDIETFNTVKGALEEFLQDIPLIKPDKSSEFEVFESICQKISKLMVYDHDAVDENNEETKNRKLFTSRNLIGALLEGKCVCTGYAELLRNLCISRGIECIHVGCYGHSVNQVKLGNKWYWFDMTLNTDKIKSGININSLLVSDVEFINAIYHIPSTTEKTYRAPRRYRGRSAINNIYRNALLGKNRATNTGVAATGEYISRKNLDKSKVV